MHNICDIIAGEGPYVPPAPTENEDEMFIPVHKGINFDKYDDIPVECTGEMAPSRGISRYTLYCIHYLNNLIVIIFH